MNHDPSGYFAQLLLSGAGAGISSTIGTPYVFGGANSWNPIGIAIIGVTTVVAVSVGIYYYKEHTKGARKSTKGKHEKGQARKQRDQGGEKGDSRRKKNPNKRQPR